MRQKKVTYCKIYTYAPELRYNNYLRRPTQAKLVKGNEIVAALAAFIDGEHAEDPADIRMVSSVGFNTLLMSTIHAATVENETLAQFVRRSGFSWRTRAGIDTMTAADDFLAAIGLSRGGGRRWRGGGVAFWISDTGSL